jgi:transcriptional regulator with XRE-family HTH domain
MARRKAASIGTLNAIIGQNVRTIREEEREWSQTRLGKELGPYLDPDQNDHEVPKQVISKIEKGLRSLDANELVAMARVLGKPVTYLMTPHGDHSDNEELALPGWQLTIAEHLRAVVGEEEATAIASAVIDARTAAIAEMAAVVQSMGTASISIQATGTHKVVGPARKARKR